MKSKELMRRKMLIDDLTSSVTHDAESRVDRFLELNHQQIIGNHHFAAASSQCIYLYRDGYFIATVMMSHAINEGIMKFVAEKNGIDREDHLSLLDELTNKDMISKDAAAASARIWKSYRNDVHHMNPKVAKLPFPEIAKKNMLDLAIIEKDVFGFDIGNGGELIPHKKQYWDVNQDGTVTAFLRFM